MPYGMKGLKALMSIQKSMLQCLRAAFFFFLFLLCSLRFKSQRSQKNKLIIILLSTLSLTITAFDLLGQ